MVILSAYEDATFANNAVSALHLVSFSESQFIVRFVNPNNGTNGMAMKTTYIAIDY